MKPERTTVGVQGNHAPGLLRILGMPKKSSVKEPWKKATPKKSSHTKLTAKSKAAAKRQAKKGGRKYPNLVDNMNAAKKQRARGAKTT